MFFHPALPDGEKPPTRPCGGKNADRTPRTHPAHPYYYEGQDGGEPGMKWCEGVA